MAERDKFWAYVTVFGTLWGGLELTLGTFLHVLHVPKTGLIMSLLSVVLLLAQRYVFPARGSTLAVGVIAACIKCLSPGGIIAGPVWGILTEALMIELALFLSSRNAAAAMFAGGLALTWSQIQSVLKMWFYYGKDFFHALIKTIEKFLSVEWSAALSWALISGFFATVFILGAIAGLVGHRMGKRVLHQLEELDETESAKSETTQTQSEQTTRDAMDIISDLAFKNPGRHKKREPDTQILRTRLCVLPIALASLSAQFAIEIWSEDLTALSDLTGIQSPWLDWTILVPTAVLGIWLATLAVAARRVLKAIWWPKFWALTIAVSLICGLILAWTPGEAWHWQVGIEATVRMLVRGIFVFSFIGWLTRSLKPAEFLTIWKKVHLEKLGLALNGAYNLLPEWLDRLNELVKTRPGGLRANLRYAHESMLTCLIDASRRANRPAVSPDSQSDTETTG